MYANQIDKHKFVNFHLTHIDMIKHIHVWIYTSINGELDHSYHTSTVIVGCVIIGSILNFSKGRTIRFPGGAWKFFEKKKLDPLSE